MPDDVAVDLLTANDPVILAQIATVSILAWQRDPTGLEIQARVERLRKDLIAMDPTEGAMFIARKDGGVLGFGRIMRDRDEASQWCLFAVAVHPRHQRHGIGSAIARAAITYARERGATQIRSQAHEDNAASIQYHTKLGFTNEGVFVAPDGDRLVAFCLRVG